MLVATSDFADHELPEVVSVMLQMLRKRLGMDVAFVLKK